jgi:hypothetical protein
MDIAKETADKFLHRVFDKYYGKQLQADISVTDYVLKVVGVQEYIYGDHLFTSFEYVQRKIAKQERIELVMFERSAMDDDVEEDEQLEEQWQQGGEEVSFSFSMIYSLFIY